MKIISLILIITFTSTLLLYANFIHANNKDRFPNSVDEIPAGYNGHLFVLIQDYPEQIPTSNKPWELYDFRTESDVYLQVIKAYFYEGMESADWRPEHNLVRTWYHMPWIHVGDHPRECIRGMTRERDSKPFELCVLQNCEIQNWGISFYNDYAAYTIGKVWENRDAPNVNAAVFQNGSVFVKLLFTTATPEQVPLLSDTVVWQANVNSTIDNHSPKEVTDVRLLQLDVAVRDSRANNTTGWVFGTFVYDSTSHGKSAWDRMIPVGLSWGNDPGITPQDVAKGKLLQETVIHPAVPHYAKDRLGWAGRLNGPVDNSRSSCLSCHGTAEWPPTKSMIPTGTLEERLRWFRNLRPDEAFDLGHQPLGYSLQLMIALQNFYKQAE